MNGKTVYMTDEQYAEFLKVSGENARSIVARMSPNDDPSEKIIEHIRKVLEKSHTDTKEQLIRKWHSLSRYQYERSRKKLLEKRSSSAK